MGPAGTVIIAYVDGFGDISIDNRLKLFIVITFLNEVFSEVAFFL